MPQPGQMTEECTVLAWHKAVGDTIAKGDALYEIETDKSNMDVESFDTGTLLAIIVAEGETVAVDSVVAWIGAAGEPVPVQETPAVMVKADARAAPTPVTAEAAGVASQSPPPEPQVAAAEVAAAEVAAAEAGTPEAAASGRRVAVSPRAARVAIELGVDPAAVRGTGPNGRIVERDVRAASAAGVGTGRAAPTVASAASSSARMAGDPEPLSRMRRIIARRLTESVTTIPSFTVSAAVDVTDIVALRADLKAAGSSISITDLVHAATISALVDHPLVNSVTDGERLWRRDAVHLGIAVSIPDGLLVPVVRDAQSLELAELSARTREVVTAAREGKLGPDDLSGSTFSVSNMGMYGVDAFDAIINPGESGILAVSAGKPMVVARRHGIVTRDVMNLTLTADHRLVDGALAATFIDAIRSLLEDASSFDVGGAISAG